MDLGTEALGRFDEVVRVAAAGALGHRPAGENGDACLVRRFGPPAAGQQQLGRDERPAGHVGMDDGQAVRQREALETREVVLTRPARTGPDVEHRQVGRVARSLLVGRRWRDDGRRGGLVGQHVGHQAGGGILVCIGRLGELLVGREALLGRIVERHAACSSGSVGT